MQYADQENPAPGRPVKEEDANVEEVGNIETDEDVLLRV